MCSGLSPQKINSENNLFLSFLRGVYCFTTNKRIYFVIYLYIRFIIVHLKSQTETNYLKLTTMTTSKQIRQSNPQGTMTMVSGTNDIKFSNVTFKSETSNEKTKLWNKLVRMGFRKTEKQSVVSEDEFDGMCQTSKLGLEFPEPTILINN